MTACVLAWALVFAVFWAVLEIFPPHNNNNATTNAAGDKAAIGNSNMNNTSFLQYHNHNNSSNINNNTSNGANQTYLVVDANAWAGSTALEMLLASSPATSTMCHMRTWQCESTSLLIREGLIPSKKGRWMAEYPNWTQAYDFFHRKKVWDNMDAPFLIDKSPSNLKKTRQLVDFFESHGHNYAFVVMGRHPCLSITHIKQNKVIVLDHDTRSRRINDTLALVPDDRILYITYEELLTRPDVVSRRLLAWRPTLKRLDFGSSRHLTKDERGKSLLEYQSQAKCQLSPNQSHSVRSDDLKRMRYHY